MIKDFYPSISVIIPTLNSEKVLRLCLSSIANQDYPKDKTEIIIVDGGSSDQTLDIARDFGVTKIVKNPLISGEGGKAVGVDHAENEIVALIDSDNLLEGKDWMQRMVEPFQDSKIVSSEPLFWIYRQSDSSINRYCSLTGINDPLCLFLGNYDRFSLLTGKWTELPVKEEDQGSYLKIVLCKGRLPTMGANGYLVRRDILQKTNYKPFLFDIDQVCQLVDLGYDTIARPKIGIIHLFCRDIKGFIIKTRRRMRDFVVFNRRRKSYPWMSLNRGGLAKFILYTLTLVPLLRQSRLGYRKKPDRAWFLHPLLCWITLISYVFGALFLFTSRIRTDHFS